MNLNRVNAASITSQLLALGFSMAGTQQLMAAQVLADARDRQRLARLLTGLLDRAAVHAAPPGGQATVKTASGVIISLDDAA
jgi:hypothetical protein